MNRRHHVTAVAIVGVVAVLGAAWSVLSRARVPRTFTASDEPVRIRPDYTDVVIPPNIAPLNFVIENRAARYSVRIHGPQGGAMDLGSGNAQIRIPIRPWRRLLQANRGGEVWFDVYAADDSGQWRRHPRITNHVADEPIDSHITYRALRPNYNFFKSIRIEQRDLESFEQTTLLDGRSFRNGCLNCHTFLNQQPDTLAISIRSGPYGSGVLLGRDGRVEKVDIKWTYTSWHPSGQLAVYSINKVRQFFHTARAEVRDVVDLDSGLFYYQVAAQTVKTAPAIADKQRLESYPTWSPDGQVLYFCSAPILWEDRDRIPLEHIEQIRYDLRRVRYDLESDTWGTPETVLSAEETGQSILLPRLSPDGRFLVFCMCDHGCFPIYQASSDLYIMDLATGEYRELDVNSEQSESWHSFSSNSRWLAFSSRRQGGPFTRTFLCYIDADGRAGKPFVLPREDPAFYESCLDAFSVPELIRGPVKISSRAFVHAVRGQPDVPITSVTGATPSATPAATEPWKASSSLEQAPSR